MTRHRLVPLVIGLLAVGTAGTLGFYEEQLPGTMNPLFAQSMADRRAQEMVFDRLFIRSPTTNDIESRVLSEYSVSPDGTQVRLTVRDGITWHDGEPLKASDICFTVAAMLDPNTVSPNLRGYRDVIADCDAPSRQGTATIRLNAAYHNPYDLLSFPILPEHPFESTGISPDDAFAVRPIGTGPMRASRTSRVVRMEAVPSAHHPASIEVARVMPSGDPQVQVSSLIAGSLDTHGMVAVPPSYRPQIMASDEVSLMSYDLRSWWFVALNTNAGPTADPRVRHALDLAIDREELRELTVGYDAADPSPPCEFISGPFIGASPYYNRAVPAQVNAEPDRVVELMREAGADNSTGFWVMDGQAVRLRIGMNAALDAEARDLLNQVGNALQGAGFTHTVQRVSADDWASKAITGQLRDDYDLLIGKWSFGQVEEVNSLFHTRTAGGEGALNIFDYSDPEVDALLEAYTNASTDTQAQDAYHDVHEKLAQERPYLFLWKLDTRSAWRREVRGNRPSPYFYFTDFHRWRLDE